MIPLRDDNPTVLWPIVTVGLILFNAAVFLYELSLDPRLLERLFYQAGMVPASLTHGRLSGAGGYATIFSSMFLHAGLMHIAGNMLYLWIFGNNIEDSMGHLRFVIFYLLTGVAAAVTHLAFNPAATVPTIGASGAVSGVLGAYLVMFPDARIRTLVLIFLIPVFTSLPASLLLVIWFLGQILGSLQTSTGIATFAHIGGFVTGWLVTRRFRQRPARRRQYS